MKRCPQCEFIYEDDQSLCDMDGVLLVFDSRTLPNNLHALTPVEAPFMATAATATRAPWRHRTFPAMAALILATVFSLVYFVSTQRTASSPAPINVPPVTAPASNLVAPPESNPTPAATEVNAPTAATDREEPKPQPTKPPATQPAKKATAKTSTTQRQPTTESKKDDSKVGNILKKTGRILKKPFKF